MWPDFKEQNEGWWGSEVRNVAGPSRVLISGWVSSKWIPFPGAAVACRPNCPRHLLITFSPKHTLTPRQPRQRDSWWISASPFHKALLAVSWLHNHNDSLHSKRAFTLSRFFCIWGNISGPLVSLRHYFNIEWVGKLTQIHGSLNSAFWFQAPIHVVVD